MNDPTPAGGDREELRRQFGIAFEEENERADIERWRRASDAERSRAIVDLMAYAEAVVASTGIRNEEPAPRLPKPRLGTRRPETRGS